MRDSDEKVQVFLISYREIPTGKFKARNIAVFNKKSAITVEERSKNGARMGLVLPSSILAARSRCVSDISCL